MRRILTIATYLILVFGFVYISWQLGRAFAMSEDQEVTIVLQDSECWVYKALIDELMEPGGKGELNAKYNEYRKRE